MKGEKLPGEPSGREGQIDLQDPKARLGVADSIRFG
jgi:hypothetical protein